MGKVEWSVKIMPFFVKWRRVVHLVLSFLLLLGLSVPYGSGKASAAQKGLKSRVVKIAAGTYHTLALKSDGTVVSWGNNSAGQAAVPAGLTGVVSIAAGGSHSLALKSDGTVVSWGSNIFGQAAVPAGLTGVVSIAAGTYHTMALKSDGTVVAWGDSGPTDVPVGLAGVVAIATGAFHSLALKSDGTVAAWGDNAFGRLAVPSGLTGVEAVAAGVNHSLALKSDGTVVAWGLNNYGQTDVPAGLTGVTAIAAGGSHSLALKSDGTVVAWGDDTYGQTDVPAGLTGVVSIAAGVNHSLALKSDGTVVAWGSNADHQTEVPDGLALPVPVKGMGVAAGRNHSLTLKSDGTVVSWGDNTYGQRDVPTALSDVTAIAAGGGHSLALKSDGTVVAWGNNGNGQTNVPAELKAPGAAIAIAAGGYHSLALQSDGTVVAWGNDTYGQTNVPAELKVPGAANAIAAGGDHSLALKSDGTVVVWGRYADDRLKLPDGLSGVVAISAGYYHSLALKADGTVVAWGINDEGQTDVPTGLSGVTAIAAGGDHSLALKSDGTVVAWGDDTYGQTDVPDGLSGVTAIAAGVYHSLALQSDGTVVAWGGNDQGQANVPGDDRLSGLTMLEGALNPAFSPSVTEYTYAYLPSSVSSVHITATLADKDDTALYVDNRLQSSGDAATVSVPGESTVIPVRVEPYLKPAITYTITVRKDLTPPVVQFGTNGNASPSRTAESIVTVTDAESGVDAASLQYAWTQSTAVPAGGWTSFASGDTLRQTRGDGNWYLHIRARDLAGNVTDIASNAFLLNNNAAPRSSGGSTYDTSGPFIDNNGIQVDPSSIDTAQPSVTLEVTPKDNTAYVSIPAGILAGLEGKNPAFFIEIQAPYGRFQIPVRLSSLIPGLTEWLAANHLTAEDVSFRITLTDKSGDQDIRAAFAGSIPHGSVMGAMVDFRIDILNTRTGQTIGAADKFSQALTRLIPMPKNMSVMPELWGAFRYNETAQKFEYVPARSVKIDGVWYVLIRSYSNRVYAAAQNPVGFADVQKHWGQPYIQQAAAKGLVEGVGGGRYEPDRTVTRAEFAAMLVRALGRGASAGSTAPYDDVKPGAWYFDAVAAAKELGLLNFAGGPKFKPDQPLTREEMASMLAAVVALEKAPNPTEDVRLDKYKDIGSVEAAYLHDVQMMVGLQIMTGTGTDTFSPKGETTRAQAAVVFIKTLQVLGMIDG
jgi:alpha-tubulin suppressor-like RCC1 family protein